MADFKRLFHGAICFEEKEGYIVPLRFSEVQLDYLSHSEIFKSRARCGASVTLKLLTEATRISFAYKFFFRTEVKSSFEIYTNGRLTHVIHDDELQDEGILDFSFEKGSKQIEIYIPHYSEAGIKDLRTDADVAPIPDKGPRVLFIGDSITQGYGSRSSSQTFVNIVARAMDYEILNQGIGGFGFDQNIVQKLPFIPDKIVVALGTNHYHGWSQTATRASIEAFFERLCKQYPDIETLVILPPYTGREQEKEGQEAYEFIRRAIVETVAAYPTVHRVSAYEMIPHRVDYFEQDFLHPSPLGMSAYGKALIDEIRRIGF